MPTGFSGYSRAVTAGIPLFGSSRATSPVRSLLWVNSGGSANSAATSPDLPITTVDAAINLANAAAAGIDSGEDYVMILPLHVETAGGAADFDIDVAGVQVVGLGNGATRPTFTLDTTTDTYAVGANGTGLSNVIFLSSIDSQIVTLDIDATTGFMGEALEFRDSGADTGIIDTVDFADESDITFKNCLFNESDVTTPIGQSCILGTTGSRNRIEGCTFWKDVATGIIELGNQVFISITGCAMETLNSNDLGIVLGATAVGYVDDTIIKVADAAANFHLALDEGNTCLLGRVFINNLDAETAGLHTPASTDA